MKSESAVTKPRPWMLWTESLGQRMRMRNPSLALRFWSKVLTGSYCSQLMQKTWRDAASLVATRWQLFLEAEPESRAWAFACYVAALDAEESAAADMAALSSRIAA